MGLQQYAYAAPYGLCRHGGSEATLGVAASGTEQRTALVNQLRAALHEYYPAAPDAFDDWTGEGPWRFVIAFPDPATLVKAGRRKHERFLHAHKLYRPQTAQERLAAFAGEVHSPDVAQPPDHRHLTHRSRRVRRIHRVEQQVAVRSGMLRRSARARIDRPQAPAMARKSPPP